MFASDDRLHEVCLAFCRLQRRWLRAIFLDVDQSMKIMQFIDRGDVKRVDSVRPFPPQFAEYPCCTVQCMVDGGLILILILFHSALNVVIFVF